MAEETERLDYSKRPPDSQIMQSTMGCWHARIFGSVTACQRTSAGAIGDAWAAWKVKNDPPGMRIDWDAVTGHGFTVDTGAASIRENVVAGPPALGGSEAGERARATARAAAWTWHDRRLALSLRLGALDGVTNWPAALTWSDEQVAEVERWLVDFAVLPEVLRT